MPSVAEQLATIPPDEAARFIASLPDAEADALLYNWRGFLARPDQIAPDGDWDIWLALAGRGFGKTELGAQWVREQVETNAAGAIALVAETAADARDVMVARLLRIFPKATRPTYTKSNRCVEFHNGAKAWTYNATEPDQLRGPEHDAAWSDEIAKWRYARETWDQLQFGLRLGERPRQIVTTTPRPIELIKAMVGGQEGKCIFTRGRTMDNRANLAASFM
jgi:phage terminase large subunit-like protein